MKSYQAMHTMTDMELLQLLIREKEGQHTVQELLAKHQTLPDLFVHAEIEELLQIKGIGLHKAHLIKVVHQLAQRLNKAECQSLPKIKNPEDVVNLIKNEMKYLQKEAFVVLLLNTKHAVTHKEIVSVGSLNASIVHPREVFKTAIKKSASAMILVHNHPSGDPSPSREDIYITKRMKEVGVIVGISVLDHVIVAGDSYHSLREEGSISF